MSFGVCPKNFGSGLPYGVASKSCEQSELAGRGRPISASKNNRCNQKVSNRKKNTPF